MQCEVGEKIFFCTPKNPDNYWAHPSLCSLGNELSNWGMNLITHVHLFPRLRMCEAVLLLLPYMPDVHRDNFTFTCLYTVSCASNTCSGKCSPSFINLRYLGLDCAPVW